MLLSRIARMLVFYVLYILTGCIAYCMLHARPTPSMPTVATRNWGQAYAPVTQLYQRASTDRSMLVRIREKHKRLYNRECRKKNPDYLSLTPAISHDIKEYIGYLCHSIEQQLGPAPTPYAIISFGSLARNEAGPYTDIEMGILIQETSVATMAYFLKFSQQCADRVYLLGESAYVQEAGMRMDEGATPVHHQWYERYKTIKNSQNNLRGTLISILQPEQLAFAHLCSNTSFDRYKPKALQLLTKHIQQVARCKQIAASKIETYNGATPVVQSEYEKYRQLSKWARSICFVYGDHYLFDRYTRLSNQYLAHATENLMPHKKTQRQTIACSLMAWDIDRFFWRLPYRHHSHLDIKHNIYRPIEQILTNLSFYFNFNVQHGGDIITHAIEQGIMSRSFGEQLRTSYNFCTGLRLKSQWLTKRQLYNIPQQIYVWQREYDRLKNNGDNRFCQKLCPQKPNSLLSKAVLHEMYQAHIPVIKAALHAAQDFFINGNMQAFQRHAIPIDRPTN